MNLHVSEKTMKKTASWTIISATITFFITWAITGSWEFGLSVSIVGRIIKIFAYYGHERFWHNRNKAAKKAILIDKLKDIK